MPVKFKKIEEFKKQKQEGLAKFLRECTENDKMFGQDEVNMYSILLAIDHEESSFSSKSEEIRSSIDSMSLGLDWKERRMTQLFYFYRMAAGINHSWNKNLPLFKEMLMIGFLQCQTLFDFLEPFKYLVLENANHEIKKQYLELSIRLLDIQLTYLKDNDFKDFFLKKKPGFDCCFFDICQSELNFAWRINKVLLFFLNQQIEVDFRHIQAMLYFSNRIRSDIFLEIKKNASNEMKEIKGSEHFSFEKIRAGVDPNKCFEMEGFSLEEISRLQHEYRKQFFVANIEINEVIHMRWKEDKSEVSSSLIDLRDFLSSHCPSRQATIDNLLGLENKSIEISPEFLPHTATTSLTQNTDIKPKPKRKVKAPKKSKPKKYVSVKKNVEDNSEKSTEPLPVCKITVTQQEEKNAKQAEKISSIQRKTLNKIEQCAPLIKKSSDHIQRLFNEIQLNISNFELNRFFSLSLSEIFRNIKIAIRRMELIDFPNLYVRRKILESIDNNLLNEQTQFKVKEMSIQIEQEIKKNREKAEENSVAVEKIRLQFFPSQADLEKLLDTECEDYKIEDLGLSKLKNNTFLREYCIKGQLPILNTGKLCDVEWYVHFHYHERDEHRLSFQLVHIKNKEERKQKSIDSKSIYRANVKSHIAEQIIKKSVPIRHPISSGYFFAADPQPDSYPVNPVSSFHSS